MLGAFASEDGGFILLCFWIVNIFVSLILVHQYTLKARECERLKNAGKRGELDFSAHVKKYLDNQFAQSRAKKFSDDELFSHDLANFRMAYLKIEAKAVERFSEPDAYWQFLSENLQRLLDLMRKYSIAKKHKMKLLKEVEGAKKKVAKLAKTRDGLVNSEAFDNCAANLDSIYQSIETKNLSANQCAEYTNRIQRLVEPYINQDERDVQMIRKAKDLHSASKLKALQAISSNCGDGSDTVSLIKDKYQGKKSDVEVLKKLEKYEKENERLLFYVDTLKAKLAQADVVAKQEPDSFDDFADEIIKTNEEEIKRLSSVVRSQKFTIHELEDEVKNSKVIESDEIAQYAEKIEQLSRAARDSELCIAVLEAELEQLNKRRTKPADGLITKDQLDMLNHEIDELKNEIMKMENINDLYASVLDFVFDAFAAENIEHLSLLLHEAISNVDYVPSLLVKAGERILDMSEDGAIGNKNKTIISSMQLNEFNKRRKGELIFRMENISGVLNPKDEQAASDDRYEHVVNLIKIANTCIARIALVQESAHIHRKVTSAVSLLQRVSFEIDKLVDAYTRSVKSNISDNMKLLKSSARSRGFDATQIATIQATETDILNQVKAYEVIRPKLRREVSRVISEIKNL